MADEDETQNIAKLTPKQREQQRLADMRDVLSNEQGQRVIWEILEKTGLVSKNMHIDLAQLSRFEGKRELGVEIHDWIMEAAPASFIKMLQTRAQEMEKSR